MPFTLRVNRSAYDMPNARTSVSGEFKRGSSDCRKDGEMRTRTISAGSGSSRVFGMRLQTIPPCVGRTRPDRACANQSSDRSVFHLEYPGRDGEFFLFAAAGVKSATLQTKVRLRTEGEEEPSLRP